MLLDNCYAFGFLLWPSSLKKKFFGQGDPPLTYFGPALDPPRGGFGPKVNTNVRGHDYFIPTKFGKNPFNDSVVKADYVFPYIYMH